VFVREAAEYRKRNLFDVKNRDRWEQASRGNQTKWSGMSSRAQGKLDI
jgi:hypothetical protein